MRGDLILTFLVGIEIKLPARLKKIPRREGAGESSGDESRVSGVVSRDVTTD